MKHDAQQVLISTLKPYKGNPRRGNVDAIRESLRKNGQYRPVVVRAKTREVLAGNHTLHAAKAEGWEHLWATFIDCDAQTAKRIVLVDNRTNDLAGYDTSELAGLLGSLPDLEGTGYSQTELDALVSELASATEGDTEPIEPPAEPRTKLGDMYVLGEHRLLCGDSTVEADVVRLIDGAKPTLIATDPPYGVDYANVVDGRKNQKAGGWRDIAGDALDDAALYELIVSVLRQPDARTLFLWHSAKRSTIFMRAMTDAGWELAQQIIWVKNALVFGGSDYQWRHEPCFYARRKGSRCYADRTQTTVWEFPKPHRPDHPTEKPIGTYEIPIANHTQPGETVYDPFAGSGTAVIAAENLKRRCYAMELDPGYCDVIVDRWERHTGRVADRG